jgi:hypothetical protein
LNVNLPGVSQFNIVVFSIADEIQSINETERIESPKTFFVDYLYVLNFLYQICQDKKI